MNCETNDCRKEKRGCKGCYYENNELKAITTQYNAFKGDLPDNTKIIFADSEYFQNGIFKDKLEELETYKKIAEKLAERVDKLDEENYNYCQSGETHCKETNRCIQCIIDWARKEVEKDD